MGNMCAQGDGAERHEPPVQKGAGLQERKEEPAAA